MARSARSTLAFLAALCIMDVVLRYPVTDHETGIDSFIFHGMATSLIARGMATWILTPLSYFGLYPLSEPSGSVFLIGSVHLTAGLTIELSILVVDIAVSILGTLGAFLLAREFSDSSRFALLFALVMSTSPEFVISLWWQVPTRIAFTALIPLLLWVMIRTVKEHSMREVGLLLIIVMLMMSFHRLTVLVALLVLAYVATSILLQVLTILRLFAPRVFLRPSFRRNASWLSLAGIAVVSGVFLGVTGVLNDYSIGEVASGTSLPVQVLNLSISLARSSGLLLPVGIIGVVVFARRRGRQFGYPFLILTVLAFIPTLFLRQYTGFYTIPITALFIAVGSEAMIARPRSARIRTATICVVVLMVFATTTPIVAYDFSRTGSMSDQLYSFSLYSAQVKRQGSWVFNDGLLGAQVAAVSGRPFLPNGGATTSFQGPELLMFGFVDRNSLVIRPLPLRDITIESDSMFGLQGVQAEADWAALLSSSVDAIPSKLAQQYQPHYLVANTAFPDYFYAYAHYYDSSLLRSAQASRYVIYCDSSVIVWQL